MISGYQRVLEETRWVGRRICFSTVTNMCVSCLFFAVGCVKGHVYSLLVHYSARGFHTG